jgi:hypothetical protein
MKVPILALVAVLQAACATTSTIETELFSIQVPRTWKIEDNKHSIVIASGDHKRGNVLLPHLTVQYCPKRNQCQPCSLDFLTGVPSQGAVWGPVNTVDRGSGVKEHRAASSWRETNTLASMLCGPLGQIYVGYVTDQSVDQADRQFSGILESLKWK